MFKLMTKKITPTPSGSNQSVSLQRGLVNARCAHLLRDHAKPKFAGLLISMLLCCFLVGSGPEKGFAQSGGQQVIPLRSQDGFGVDPKVFPFSDKVTIVDGTFMIGKNPLHLGHHCGDSAVCDFIVTPGGKWLFGQRHAHLASEAGCLGGVLFAGQIKIKNGYITFINNSSGHYIPSLLETHLFLLKASQRGIDLSRANVEVWFGNPDSPKSTGKYRCTDLLQNDEAALNRLGANYKPPMGTSYYRPLVIGAGMGLGMTAAHLGTTWYLEQQAASGSTSAQDILKGQAIHAEMMTNISRGLNPDGSKPSGFWDYFFNFGAGSTQFLP
ncbi:MAG: hypothetical protein JW384_00031 [Nitrosomonadaceae bacterium]|nr:hypothetical protein [Nitrosomonadaceae bacterium]